RCCRRCLQGIRDFEQDEQSDHRGPLFHGGCCRPVLYRVNRQRSRCTGRFARDRDRCPARCTQLHGADPIFVQIIKTAGDYYDTVEGELSQDILADARELADEQFAFDEWNRQL
ncbi:MAG: hypothetical protein V5A34_10750, partial [Halapricum sp.]